MRSRRVVLGVVLALLLLMLGACADRNVEVSAKGQIIVGGSIGKGL